MQRTTLLTCLAIAIPQFAAGQPVPREELTTEWGVGGSGTCNTEQTFCSLNAGSPIYAWNNYIEQYIRHGRREYGIDLVWWRGSQPFKGIRLIRRSGTLDPVTYGEPLALYVEGGKFLKYDEREYGINLVWSDTPVFEWKIDGGTPGMPVNRRKHVGFMNTKIGQYVVYCEREYGINLKWAKDCSRRPRPKPVGYNSVDVRLTLPGTRTSGDCASSGRVRFTLTPISIAVHKGVDVQQSKELSWNKAPTNGCWLEFVTGIAPGTWRLTATNLIDWTTECVLEIPIRESNHTTHPRMVYRQRGCLY